MGIRGSDDEKTPFLLQSGEGVCFSLTFQRRTGESELPCFVSRDEADLRRGWKCDIAIQKITRRK